MANSALESIIKEILKDERLSSKINGKETLYKLSQIILKEFRLTTDEFPEEIKTVGRSLLAANQAIEGLRSRKTNFHGKTSEDYLINDSLYTYFIINSVTTIGLFLISFFENKYPSVQTSEDEEDDLPF